MTAAAVAAAVAAQRGLVARLLDGVAAIGADAPGFTRDAFDSRENAAQALVRREAEALGLACSTDAAANLHMRWACGDGLAPRLLLGSHLDTVIHGGNFDGAAGVVAALAAVAAVRALGIAPRQHVDVLALRCEEAVWFQLGLIGSRAALGRLPAGALSLTHAFTGRTLAQHVDACGGDSAALASGHMLIEPSEVRAYLEVHIEQAPQLVEAGLPAAVCTGIPGNIRHPRIRITSEDAHVGLPRRFRRDAALAGAELALALEALWQREDAAGRAMACTIGRFHTLADRHAMTVVPGAFEMSLDLRAYDAAHLAALEAELHAIVARIAAARGVTIDLGERNAGALGPMDAAMQAQLAAAAARLGLGTMPLGSPASHDAANFAAAGIPTAMLLVRNQNGSHNPHEAMELDDLMAAIAILALWLAEQA